jgi:hypothetical protein
VFAIAIAGVGACGIWSNTQAEHARLPATRYPVLFGCLFAAYVVMRFRWHAEAMLQGEQAERRLVRHLSRLVYLGLYGLFGAAAVIAIVEHREFASDAQNLQGYFVAGLLVLILIRILAVYVGSPQREFNVGLAADLRRNAVPVRARLRHWIHPR